uniref:Uncharacterized protein n=1 Tax=Aegilops tauschii subsp. strangulata TaxID=200361 RepID=A0A453T4X7_AEGTS
VPIPLCRRRRRPIPASSGASPRRGSPARLPLVPLHRFAASAPASRPRARPPRQTLARRRGGAVPVFRAPSAPPPGSGAPRLLGAGFLVHDAFWSHGGGGGRSHFLSVSNDKLTLFWSWKIAGKSLRDRINILLAVF